MNSEVIWSSFLVLLKGVPLTLLLSGLGIAAGFVLAIGLSAFRLSKYRALRWVSESYLFLFRGTPLLVQLFLIYYGLSQLEAVRNSVFWFALRDPFWCATIALALNTAAYASEIIRGGVLAVPPGHLESARAMGMSRIMVLRRIIIPISARQALPAYGNEVILLIKATSLASIITLLEITGLARQLISRTYAVFEVFIAAGIIYLLINLTVVTLIRFLEVWLHPERRPRMSNS